MNQMISYTIKRTIACIAGGLLIGSILILLLSCSVQCSAQTRQQVLKELYRQNIPHAKIVLAQARLESGNFKSLLYKRTNNLFGIKAGKKYKEYPHWRKSIEDYRRLFSKKYTEGSYYKFLEDRNYSQDPNYNKKLRRIVNEK